MKLVNLSNWFVRHKTLSFLIIVILIIVVVAAANSGGKDNNSKSINGTSIPIQSNSSSANTQVSSPAPPPSQKIYQGSGDDVVDIQKPTDGAAILSFECSNCTSNTVVKTNGAESLVVNTIGSYSGSHLIDISSGSNTSQVTITATASWKLTISGLDKAT